MIQHAPQNPVNYLPPVQDSYDVVVIGGGPAGATTAALVAEHGYSVLLLERAALPRFHVGESLIPETYWPLKRLGMLDRMKASAFPRKYSVQFVSRKGKLRYNQNFTFNLFHVEVHFIFVIPKNAISGHTLHQALGLRLIIVFFYP